MSSRLAIIAGLLSGAVVAVLLLVVLVLGLPGPSGAAPTASTSTTDQPSPQVTSGTPRSQDGGTP